jgi:hypothetical protein
VYLQSLLRDGEQHAGRTLITREHITGPRPRARVWVGFLLFLAAGGCSANIQVADEQQIIACEAKGFRPGTDANLKCAVKLTEDQKQAGIVQAPRPAVPVAPLSPPPPPRSRILPQLANIIVPPGRTSTIVFAVSTDVDCKADGLPDIRIGTMPSHGAAAIIRRDDYPGFPLSSPRAACNNRKIDGLALNYTPAADFTGDDFIAYSVKTNSEGESAFKLTITVKAPSAPGAPSTLVSGDETP